MYSMKSILLVINVKYCLIAFAFVQLYFSGTNGSYLNGSRDRSLNAQDYIDLNVEFRDKAWSENQNVPVSIMRKAAVHYVLAAFYKSKNDDNLHLFTLYGLPIGSWKDVAYLFKKIALLRCPTSIFNRHKPDFVGKLTKYIISEIIKLGYRVYKDEETLSLKQDFLKYFQFDRWINEQVCFVFKETRSLSGEDDRDYRYFVCLSPFLTRTQVKFLYPENHNPLAHVDYKLILSIVSLAFKIATIIICSILPDFRRGLYGQCIILHLIPDAMVDAGDIFNKIIQFKYNIDIQYFQSYIGISASLALLIMCFNLILSLSGNLRALSSCLRCQHPLILYIIIMYGSPVLITINAMIECLSDDEIRIYKNAFMRDVENSNKKMERLVIILTIILAVGAAFYSTGRYFVKVRWSKTGRAEAKKYLRDRMFLVYMILFTVTLVCRISRFTLLGIPTGYIILNLSEARILWEKFCVFISISNGLIIFIVLMLTLMKPFTILKNISVFTSQSET